MTQPREPVVVITGGTAGVGRATARRFAGSGARIAVLARGQDRLEATARELSGLGARAALAIRCDVAEPAQVFAAAAQIEQELGPIDIWINNAMTTVFGRFRSLTPEQYERVTRVTYLGYVWGTRAALDHMIPRNRGTIVQVGSALAYRSIPLQSAYCGAKHAIVGFTDSIRSELLHDGVAVALTCVHLPAVNTPQFSWCLNKLPYEPEPVPPIFQPEIIADAIFHAAHHPRREVYLGWPTVKAVFGQRLAPGYADRYLARHGFSDQTTDEPRDPARPANLFAPVPGDPGAHGRFDDQARDRDLIAPATARLGAAGVTAIAVAALAAGLAGAIAGAMLLLRRR
ncbi:MAG TPA: SDR family oxidoreductase [Kofleriaceae bacterium]|jgi:NAD(P)-dependent dehydrogenase (short-subunit alcohol dehydrogenase family)|nr:SDR family oxidoreductase [Kofleriaceae bacterium]